MPDWYPLLQAAKYLGVAPWELAARPAFWMEMALTAAGAEGEASESHARRERARATRGAR